ncbi:MAG: SDR family oxidoreductase [Sporichthyaceae bacterium]
MSAPILVTGGTGVLGRLVVRELLARGRAVRVLSRRPRPGVPDGTPPAPGEPEWAVADLHTGVGLPAALQGVVAVAHCAVGSRDDAQMGAQLMIAAARAGGAHIVFHSATGAEAIRSRFYRDKRAMERLLEDGSLPWTVLRTTVLHEEIVAGFAAAARFPVMRVAADEKFQPIAAFEVADRLADLVGSTIQAHYVPPMGGPQILPAMELAGIWLKESRKIRKVVAMKIPGGEHDGWRTGVHLLPDRMIGEQTFAEFLVASREGAAAEEAAQKAAKAAAKEAAKAAEREAKDAEKAAREQEKAAEKAARAAEKDKRAQAERGAGGTGPAQSHS